MEANIYFELLLVRSFLSLSLGKGKGERAAKETGLMSLLAKAAKVAFYWAHYRK